MEATGEVYRGLIEREFARANLECAFDQIFPAELQETPFFKVWIEAVAEGQEWAMYALQITVDHLSASVAEYGERGLERFHEELPENFKWLAKENGGDKPEIVQGYFIPGDFGKRKVNGVERDITDSDLDRQLRRIREILETQPKAQVVTVAACGPLCGGYLLLHKSAEDGEGGIKAEAVWVPLVDAEIEQLVEILAARGNVMQEGQDLREVSADEIRLSDIAFGVRQVLGEKAEDEGLEQYLEELDDLARKRSLESAEELVDVSLELVREGLAWQERLMVEAYLATERFGLWPKMVEVGGKVETGVAEGREGKGGGDMSGSGEYGRVIFDSLQSRMIQQSGTSLSEWRSNGGEKRAVSEGEVSNGRRWESEGDRRRRWGSLETGLGGDENLSSGFGFGGEFGIGPQRVSADLAAKVLIEGSDRVQEVKSVTVVGKKRGGERERSNGSGSGAGGEGEGGLFGAERREWFGAQVFEADENEVEAGEVVELAKEVESEESGGNVVLEVMVSQLGELGKVIEEEEEWQVMREQFSDSRVRVRIGSGGLTDRLVNNEGVASRLIRIDTTRRIKQVVRALRFGGFGYELGSRFEWVKNRENDFVFDWETGVILPQRFLVVRLANRVADWAMKTIRVWMVKQKPKCKKTHYSFVCYTVLNVVIEQLSELIIFADSAVYRSVIKAKFDVEKSYQTTLIKMRDEKWRRFLESLEGGKERVVQYGRWGKLWLAPKVMMADRGVRKQETKSIKKSRERSFLEERSYRVPLFTYV